MALRITHVCTGFSRLSETFIYDLILALDSAGAEGHVLTAARYNVMQRPYPRVTVVRPSWSAMAWFAVRRRLGLAYKFPWSQVQLLRVLEKQAPDILLAHFGGAGAAIAPCAHKLGCPLIVVFHAFDLFSRRFSASTYAPLWRMGAEAVAISEHGRQRLLQLGCPPERVRVIHCGIEPERYNLPSLGHRPPEPVRILAIGRLVEKKGFDDLIRAAARLRSQMPPRSFEVCIWGEGPLRGRLMRLIHSLNLRETVRLCGALPHEQVPQVLAQAHLFVLPSRTASDGDTEGIPITLLEAQAARRPVVASRHGGIPEALPPANHEWLVREGHIEELANKLATLMDRPSEWPTIGERGAEWVACHFRLDAEAAAYMALFRQQMERRSNRPPKA